VDHVKNEAPRPTGASTFSQAAEFPFLMVLTRHLGCYPLMQLEDIYKLVHQASFGSHHRVNDAEQARRHLERELEELPEGPPDPTLDPISPDGRILRVHLRPYLIGGGDPNRLLAAFVRTASEFHGSLGQFKLYWSSVEEMARADRLPFAATEIEEWTRRMASLNYPAVHHSEVYRRAYRPAYRVVCREFLPPSLLRSSG
jgi:hypothetical protein